MSADDSPEAPGDVGRVVSYMYREFIPVSVQGLADAATYATLPPIFIPPAMPTDPRLSNQSGPTAAPGAPVTLNATNIYSVVRDLQAEVRAISGFRAEHLPLTPTTAAATTTTTATAPLPRTIASGRGAASPEVFQEMVKTNWHGRLGRTHMVDVDGLPDSALTELDCLLRRKLQATFPLSGEFSAPDADTIFASLAALGLRMEDRGGYADALVVNDSSLPKEATARRARNFVEYYYTYGNNKFGEYWRGFAVETLLELARYRGLIDDKGSLKIG